MLPSEFLTKKYAHENLPPETLRQLAWIALETRSFEQAAAFDEAADKKFERERSTIVNARPETD